MTNRNKLGTKSKTEKLGRIKIIALHLKDMPWPC